MINVRNTGDVMMFPKLSSVMTRLLTSQGSFLERMAEVLYVLDAGHPTSALHSIGSKVAGLNC